MSAASICCRKVSNLARPDWLTYSGAKDEFIVAAGDGGRSGQRGRPVRDGRRAKPPTPDDDRERRRAALLPGGIALQMTECDVVRRAGAPEQLQIGADERGERAVVITYIRGPRPGIYRFARRTADVDRARRRKRRGAKAAPKAKRRKRPRAPDRRRRRTSALIASAHRRFMLLAGGEPVVFGACERVHRVGAILGKLRGLGRIAREQPGVRQQRRRCARSRRSTAATDRFRIGDPAPQRRELDAQLRGGAAGVGAARAFRPLRRAPCRRGGRRAPAAGSRRGRRRTA